MDDEAKESAFYAALANEYFVLQSVASTTVGESGTRASLYVGALSSTLVAIGFVSQSATALGPFLAVALPTLFVMGAFTIVRLVDTGVQNMSALSAKAKISRYWAALTPDAKQFFGSELSDARAAVLSLGITSNGQIAGLFSIASMIAVMNSVVAGSAVTLAFVSAAGADRMGAGVLAGVATGLLSYGWFLTYQSRRYKVLLVEMPGAP